MEGFNCDSFDLTEGQFGEACWFTRIHQRTKREDSLRKHNMLVHKRDVEWFKYDFKKKHRGNFGKHRSAHDRRWLNCGSCKFRTKRNGHLDRHMLAHKDDTAEASQASHNRPQITRKK
ncbi:hypothetical protein NQ315_007438 [Exocentrus adspersus]|uniref:C2H2-type domain-containing protein n=1 Tax=Exocentrus adspersus TaxID=1586481 RepID=A0AAV8VIW7_9CUCU|nr:hypothetical protein NQ315_007438 [Exocentrus adspersus]